MHHHHPVSLAFGRLLATLPAWRAHLSALVDGLYADGIPLPCTTVLVSVSWKPGRGISTAIERTCSDLDHLSAHRRMPLAGALADQDLWTHATAGHVEALLAAVVANDRRKPALQLDFFAQADRASTPLRLRLQEHDAHLQPPNRFDDLDTDNTPRVLRGLRLAAMAKGVGTGPRWSLSVNGVRSQFRVQAPTARTALAWMVGAQLHEIPEWAAHGKVLELSVDHIAATPLLQRWARMRPQAAPTPALEDHLGF